MVISGVKFEVLNIISKITNNFQVSECGPFDFILGIKINKSPNNNSISYSISQSAFINDILDRFNISFTKTVHTPCSGNNSQALNDKPFDPSTYKSAIGSFIFLAKCTRPDISFSVLKAARHCESPTLSDWKKVANIFRYLSSTKNY